MSDGRRRGYAGYLDRLNPVTREAVNQFYGGDPADMGYDPNNPYGNISPYRYSNYDAEDNPGDKLYADLIRAQLADYMGRFSPVEEYLAGQITATGTGQLEADLERTREAVIGARENVTGQQARARGRYGLSAVPASARRANQTVSTLVGGLNTTRQRDADRQEALLTGGLGSIGEKARNIG